MRRPWTALQVGVFRLLQLWRQTQFPSQDHEELPWDSSPKPQIKEFDTTDRYLVERVLRELVGQMLHEDLAAGNEILILKLFIKTQ